MDKAAPTYNRRGPYVGVCTMCSDQETTDLVIDGVPFGHKHSIDAPTLTHTPDTRKIPQGTVKLGQLINSFISHKGLANKENFVRIIDRYQLGESAHQWLEDI